jgi:hypothetical protein
LLRRTILLTKIYLPHQHYFSELTPLAILHSNIILSPCLNTAIAQRKIAAFRSHSKHHTIL